jgi:O-6-methylguanine DNA methyltransferase
MDKAVKYSYFDTSIGEMLAAHSPSGLCRLALPGETEEEFKRWASRNFKGYTLEKVYDSAIGEVEKQLNEYLNGKRKSFSLQLDLKGTLFQRRVWQVLLQIPYGTTVSYKDVAIAMDMPRAVRAVGQANNRNPIAIIVPCHRVIGSDGSLVGYGGGLDIKKKLLMMEGIAAERER